MTEILNERFGISVDYNIDDNGIIGKVHFYSANMVEIEAYVIDHIKDYQEDIKKEMELLRNAKTKEEIIDCLENRFGWITSNNFNEKDFENGYNQKENSYLLDFNEFKVKGM